MAELDHLIYASRNIDDGASAIEALPGVAAVAGGPHIGLGTHNHLLTFDERTYFEIIGIDPNQPEPDHSRPFGLDRREDPQLVGYAIHPTGDETLEDVVTTMRSAGIDPGSIAEMSRRRPDGSVLSWRLTRGGDRNDEESGADMVYPFAIDWGGEPSPATTLPSMGSLLGLRVSHPDQSVRDIVAALQLGVEVADGPAGLTASVRTNQGPVEIS